jgi:hypothetical protein
MTGTRYYGGLTLREFSRDAWLGWMIDVKAFRQQTNSVDPGPAPEHEFIELLCRGVPMEVITEIGLTDARLLLQRFAAEAAMARA